MKLLKKFAAVLAAVALLAGAAVVLPGGAFPDAGMTVCAEELTSGEYTYEVNEDGTVTITKYTGADAAVVIPAKIDTKAVTVIGYNAFANCTGLTSVTIPDSVTGISVNAFFACSNLTSVTIPDSVTDIGYDAFSDTPWLRAKQEENPIVIVNNVVINGTTCFGDITIPNSVTGIGDGAFSGCIGLTGITIPDSVTSIGVSAFFACSNLKSVTIPDSVTVIGVSAFSDCTGLTSITISDGVTDIGRRAFSGCDGLTSVTIPDSVAVISYGAFYYCTGLTNLTILNPDCDIYQHSDTLGLADTTTISGYESSTAQAYAEKYSYTFVSLDTAYTLGDIDGNGTADSLDAAAILTASALEGAGLDSGLTEAQQKAADVDKSGQFDSVDAAYILQYSAYLGAGLGSGTLDEYMAKQ